VWKEVKNFSKYEVNEFGNVRHKKLKKILSPYIGSNGYYKISMWTNDRKRKRVALHRIVADVFCNNPYNKSQVNHIDGNKLNNNACNLEWCTPSENIQHSISNGLRVNKRGTFSIAKNISYRINGNNIKEYVVHVYRNHKKKIKTFSCKKYGELEARKLAFVARYELIRSLS